MQWWLKIAFYIMKDWYLREFVIIDKPSCKSLKYQTKHSKYLKCF